MLLFWNIEFIATGTTPQNADCHVTSESSGAVQGQKMSLAAGEERTLE